MSEQATNRRGLSAVASAFCEQPMPGMDPTGGDGNPLLGRLHKPDAFSILEPLEARELMSVSLDSAGWTVVTPASDSRLIYVSTSRGSDGNTGLSTDSPVRSLSKAISLVRNGSADQLLLKRGDTFSDSFGTWTKSGRSADQPIVIGSYGQGDRPVVKTGTSNGINLGSASAKTINNVAIMGLHFWADGRDPSVGGYNKTSQPYGINVISGGSGLLIEDMKIEKFMTNISFYPVLGQMHDVTIRRSEILDAYDVGNTQLHAQGLFADGVQGLKLQDNVFDHNGWSETVSGAKPTIYNHNAYVTGTNSGLVAIGNIFANASSHGLQARCGGVVVGNLFLHNPIGLTYGIVNGSGVTTKGGVSGEVSHNVFLGGRDIDGQDRGIAMDVGNIRANSNTVIKENIISSYTDSWAPAITLNYGVGVDQASGVGINDLTLRDNVIYNWTRGLQVTSGLSPTAAGYKHLENVVLRGNKFSNISKEVLQNGGDLTVDNRNEVSATTFSDPSRDVAAYNKSLGGQDAESQFMTAVRNRSQGAWDSRYTAVGAVDFVRAGFGLNAIGGTPISVTPPSVPPVVSPPATRPPSVPPVVVPPTVPPTVPPAVPPVVEPPAVEPPAVGKSVRHKVSRSRAAVYVKKLKYRLIDGAQALVVKFSRDVGASIDASDLQVTAAGQAVPTDSTMTYDAKKREATFYVSRGASPRLDGKFEVTVKSSGIADERGNLDGNRDRIGGDDYSRDVKIKWRSAA